MANIQTRSAAIAASEDIVPVVAENTYSISAATGGGTAVTREGYSIAATTAAGANAIAEQVSSVAAATGIQAYAVSEQSGSVSAVTGYVSHAIARHGSIAAATGERAEAHAGQLAIAAAIGDQVRAVAAGHKSMAIAAGNWAKVTASYPGSIAVTTGLATGAKGSVLVFVRAGDADTPAIVKTVRVGEGGIEPFVAYQLNDEGEVEEAPFGVWNNA